jgi:threonine/homoserine/homoserine lactone efflux protein
MTGSIAVALLQPAAVATIRWGALGPLVVASLAIMGSPGPATLSVVAVGSAYGFRRSVSYVFGIVLGTMLVLAAVATGITAMLLAIPALRVALVALSAAYILWLAYRVATAPPLGDPAAGTAPPSLRSGALLGVANPKGWVAIAAVFASVRLSDAAGADAAAKTAVLTAMIVLIMGTWLVAGASSGTLLRDPRRARVINVALAAALVGATVLALLH